MTIYNRIWLELSQAKKNEIFASLLSMRQRKYLNYFNIFIIIASTGGAMGWKIWEYAPIVSTSIVAIASLLKQMQNELIFDEDKIAKLITIQNFYSDYFSKLEKLFYNYFNSKIDEDEAFIKFYDIKATESEINTTVNETIIDIPKNLDSKAQIKMEIYLKTLSNI